MSDEPEWDAIVKAKREAIASRPSAKYHPSRFRCDLEHGGVPEMMVPGYDWTRASFEAIARIIEHAQAMEAWADRMKRAGVFIV